MFKNILLRIVLILSLTTATFPLLATSAHAAGEPECIAYEASGWDCTSNSGAVTLKKILDPANLDEACPVTTPFIRQVSGNELTCKSLPKNLADSANAEKLVNTVSFLVQVESFLSKAIWPILAISGKLIDNSLLFGNGMEDTLLSIWRPIRDLVNVLFVIGLVVIAIYNIAGVKNDGNLAIKSALPKVIIGILLVNFSFVAMKVFLDVTNVITVAIFSIPSEVGAGESNISNSPDLLVNLCASYTGVTVGEATGMTAAEWKATSELYHAKRIAQDSDDILAIDKEKIKGLTTVADIRTLFPADKRDNFDKILAEREDGELCTKDTAEGGVYKLTPNGEAFLKTYNSQNAAFLMAVNLGGIVFYDKVGITDLSFDKFIVNAIFSVVLYLIYLLSFLSLFVVLLGRVVVLWLSIAISPILLILIAAPELKSKLSGFDDITDQFFKNALAPITIGLAMSIGWIMLRAIQKVNYLASSEQGMNLQTASGIPIVGLTSLQDFIVAAGTIAVVWKAVFGAAKGTLAEGAVTWMQNLAKSVGTFVATAPLKYSRIIPIKLNDGKTGDDAKHSAAELLFAGQEAMYQLKNGNKDRLSKRILGYTGPSDTTDITAPNYNVYRAGIYKTLANGINKPQIEAMMANKQNFEQLRREMAKGKAEELKAFNRLTSKEFIDNFSSSEANSLSRVLVGSEVLKAGAAEAEKEAKEAAAKAAPAAPAAVKPADKVAPDKTKVAGQTINFYFGDNPPAAKVQDYKAKVESVSSALDAKDKPAAIAALEALRLKLADNSEVAPTPAEARELFGKDKLETLTAKELKDALEKTTTTPPPAVPPAPGTP